MKETFYFLGTGTGILFEMEPDETFPTLEAAKREFVEQGFDKSKPKLFRIWRADINEVTE
jgi:hypothetical protein